MHWTADTENGDWTDNPDEAQLAALVAGLGQATGTFITLTPADADWYASVSLLPDGTTQIHRGDPSRREDNKAVTTASPADIARDLTAWLANR